MRLEIDAAAPEAVNEPGEEIFPPDDQLGKPPGENEDEEGEIIMPVPVVGVSLVVKIARGDPVAPVFPGQGIEGLTVGSPAELVEKLEAPGQFPVAAGAEPQPQPGRGFSHCLAPPAR